MNAIRQRGGGQSSQAAQASDVFTTLPELLSSSTTIPLLSTFPEEVVDSLLSSLPAPLLLLAHRTDSSEVADPSEDEITLNSTLDSDEKVGVIMSLPIEQKRTVLSKVLRSPQLHQSLGSLTVALRDGGLPSVAGGLGIEVKNGGFVRGSAMPMGGGEAVRAFLEGVKENVEKEKDKGDDKMETD
jgi:26S proteasome regulatory subunit N13